jgi:hypothetical protein
MKRPEHLPGNKPSLEADTVRAARRLAREIRERGGVPHWKLLARQLGVASPDALRAAVRGEAYRWVS